MKLPNHGTYERFIGSDRFPGCDCKPCNKAAKLRDEARKLGWVYYKRAEVIPRTGHRNYRNEYGRARTAKRKASV